MSTNGSVRRATREGILTYKDLEQRDVEVPEWGGVTVTVRELSCDEREELLTALSRAAGKDGGGETQIAAFIQMKIRAVRLACIDELGDQLFSKKDEAELRRKSLKAIDRLYEPIAELSAMAGAAEVEAVQDAEDFSVETPAGVSSSA